MPFPAPYAEQLGKGASEPVVAMLQDLIEKGKPIPPIPILIAPPTAGDQVLVAIGRAGQLVTSPESINASLTFFSIRTASQSAIGFLYAQDQVAKTFYALGFIFAGTAAGCSSTAVFSKPCSISKVGVVGETIGEAFYQAAEEANRIALAREKKPIPVRKPIFRRNKGPGAFVLPSSNRIGAYRIIISNVAFIVMAYGSIKIIRTTCKKARRILLKRRQLKRFKLLKKSTTFLFTSICINKIRKSKMTDTLHSKKSCLFSAV